MWSRANLWRRSKPRRAGDPLGPAPSLSSFSGDRNSFRKAAATFSFDRDVIAITGSNYDTSGYT